MSTLLDAPIVAVTVFVDRARITRRATLQLPAGEHTLVLQHAPRTIDPDTIRASGRGSGLRISGVDMVTRHTAITPIASTAALQQQLESLRDRATELADEDGLQADRVELLNGLRNASGERFARALANGKANLDTLMPVAQFLTDDLEKVLTRRREISIARRELDRQIKALEATLKQSGSTGSRQWNDILVSVENDTATELTLDIIYMVHGASWQPVYDIRLLDTTVQLTYLAQVRQQTGEEWPPAEMTLSTARPASSMTIPKLTPWYVDKFVPRPPVAMPPMRAMATMSAGIVMEERTPYPASDAMLMAEAEHLTADIESSGAAVTYRVARPVAVASDGSMHKTTVMVLNLDAVIDYVIAPAIALECYLRATIRNNTAVMLLPGKALVFHGADYVGSMELPRVIAPNEEFEAQLGIEDRIKVERELTERTTAKNLIGNIRRTTVGYKIKLTNNLSTPAHITLYDQVPVARHEDIKIKLQDAQPRPTEQSDLNIMKWVMDLPAQSKREVTFTFSIEHPRDVKLTGLGILDAND